MDVSWTFPELVAEAASSIATLPAPKNGQVRAVPDERTVRYYATLGLLDRPLAMRGRTALYGRRHLAQVVAIKRLQSAGRSLAEIQALWATLDDATLARMSGVALGGRRGERGEHGDPSKKPRRDFWKTPPAIAVPPSKPVPYPVPPRSLPMPATKPVELRVELATGADLVITIPADAAFDSADVAALRAAAAPLVTELARRGLILEIP
ncbi:MAG TPA: MerR family transcriptional regulator [Kofleriaceae bacterium]